jgi:DNA-binding GntR family transcriptional regulator
VRATDNSSLIPRASLSDAVYERLRDEIMHGEIPDGTRLSQVQLAERYGVSRIPIREALRRLQAESLVVATPYHPFVVRNVTVAQILELVDVRAALEDLALSKREPVTERTVVEMRRINEQMARGRDATTFLTLDRQLHQLIGGSSTMTIELINDIRDRVHKYVTSMVDGKSGRATATQEHAGIIDALESHDVELARSRMREHVMKSRQFIMKRLGAEAGEAAGTGDVGGPARARRGRRGGR